jgi:hypothetical protein
VPEATGIAEAVLRRPHDEVVDMPPRFALIDALSLQRRGAELIGHTDAALTNPHASLTDQAGALGLSGSAGSSTGTWREARRQHGADLTSPSGPGLEEAAATLRTAAEECAAVNSWYLLADIQLLASEVRLLRGEWEEAVPEIEGGIDVVNFDNIHTVPRSAFRCAVTQLSPGRMARACRTLRAATGC